jgi:hypothetical protein
MCSVRIAPGSRQLWHDCDHAGIAIGQWLESQMFKITEQNSVWVRPSFSDIQNFDRLCQTLTWGTPGRWCPFVSYVAIESKIGDRLCDESVVEFLRGIGFVPARHSTDMKMNNPPYVVSDCPANISICDLGMIDIKKQLNARRVHSLANLEAPGDMVTELIWAVVLVHDFRAQIYSFVLSVSLESVKKRDAVVSTLLVRNTSPLAADKEDGKTSVFGTEIDFGVR